MAEQVYHKHISCPIHCCKIHGCKYGYEDCPVLTGQINGLTGDCEMCNLEREGYYDDCIYPFSRSPKLRRHPELARKSAGQKTILQKSPGKIYVGQGCVEAGVWELKDGRYVTKMYRCSQECSKDKPFPTTDYIDGVNDHYEDGYVLLVDENTLIEVPNDLDPQKLNPNFLTEDGDFIAFDPDFALEGSRIKFWEVEETKDWGVPAEDL
jgi:hypothetical protein